MPSTSSTAHPEKVTMAKCAQLINASTALSRSQNNFVVTPVGHVFAMYADHQSGQSVRSVFNAPTILYDRAQACIFGRSKAQPHTHQISRHHRREYVLSDARENSISPATPPKSNPPPPRTHPSDVPPKHLHPKNKPSSPNQNHRRPPGRT